MKHFICFYTAVMALAASSKHASALATSRALSTLPDLPTVDVVWDVEVRPGKKVALTGTAQQVVAKALELNPDFQMKKIPTSPSQPQRSSGSSSNNTRLFKRDYTLCGGDPALQHRTWENIQYLFGLGQTLRIESHTCGRLACQYNSGIEWCNYPMAVSFITLPTELISKVLESLERVDHVSILCTCRQLQALAMPFVFQSVSFTAGGVENTAGRALLLVRKYGNLVKELRAKVPHPVCDDFWGCMGCRWGNNPERDFAPQKTTADALLDKQNRWLSPDTVTLLAADRAMLPKRTRLVLCFSESLESHHGAFFDMGCRNLENPSECVVPRSDSRANAIFEAMVAGQTDRQDGAGRAFNQLTVLNYAPSFDTRIVHGDAWRRFLGGIQDFELSLHGDHCPIDTNPAYRGFLKQLEGIFFKYLPAVRRLRFEAHPWGPMGIRRDDHDEQLFPFELSDMPALQELELVNVVIGPGLTRRLTSGLRRGPYTLKFISSTVQSLEATMYPDRPYPLLHDSYADFFDGLTDAKILIRSLHIDPTDCEIEDPQDTQPRDPDATDKIAAAPALRESRPDLPIFPYSYDCQSGGALCVHPAQNAWAFVEGRDRAAYDRLMAWVDNVRTRYGGIRGRDDWE
ncbi:hypothetical protein PspLS_09322 [Pyricularia sp. CBS 133598]|nr:hypothetical protein PspLS_09322 [Pyricularia sp. CBS 133598]